MPTEDSTFQVHADGESYIVEAQSMVEAIGIYKSWAARDWSVPVEEVDDPEHVTCLASGPTLRRIDAPKPPPPPPPENE